MNDPDLTPPIEAGDLELPPEPPKWPKVIGIISICWAGLGLTCTVCGVAGGAVGYAFMPESQRSQFPPNFGLTPGLMATAAFGTLNAGLLLIAGILTLRRKPLGGLLHLVVAAISILLFAVNVYFTMEQQAIIAQWARENSETQYAKQLNSGSQQIGQIVGWAFGALLGLGYPIFLLIWFGVVKRGAAAFGPQTEQPRI
ncbi:hypothetical protein PHYC_01392 [Phycisphaerales bacterium]|nr:hypothetical protein PHYC_01392 [Phycisphaerales bacterium]